MFYLLTVLILIASIALVLLVIVQKSKGGGLASPFASTNNIMGVRKTTDVLEKATWWLFGIVAVLCIARRTSSARVRMLILRRSRSSSRMPLRVLLLRLCRPRWWCCSSAGCSCSSSRSCHGSSCSRSCACQLRPLYTYIIGTPLIC